MAAAKTLLLIGAGPRVGDSVARAFAEKGYKVALAVSRTVTHYSPVENQI